MRVTYDFINKYKPICDDILEDKKGEYKKYIDIYRHDVSKFAEDVLNIKLNECQKLILNDWLLSNMIKNKREYDINLYNLYLRLMYKAFKLKEQVLYDYKKDMERI